MFTTGEIVGLAEWIIDDTFLVFLFLYASLLLLFVLEQVLKKKKSHNSKFKIVL